MLRYLRIVLAVSGMAAATAFASPTAPVAGAEYMLLKNPQPVQATGKKVEVVEFFMYHCPACNALEPLIEGWVKRQGDNIHFRRVHMPFTGPNDPEAHLHLTLEAMGKSEEMSRKVFYAFHVQRVRINKEEVIFDWIAKNGIDPVKFKSYWNSFGVMTKLKRQQRVLEAYGVDSVPTLVIDGRYLTSPSIIGKSMPGKSNFEVQRGIEQVLDALVAKAKAGKQ